jgi:mannose/fructose/N-acetylgalactosamine-specific phosphotransferase system component IIC
MTRRDLSQFYLHPAAVLRLLAAASLFGIGGVHIQQYIVQDYRVIPTIGPLFLLNFIAGTVLGLYFLIPARARVGRVRARADTVAELSGLAVAIGGAVALTVSEHTKLFGFMEHGYRFAIVFTFAAEGVAIVVLGTMLAMRHASRRRSDRSHPRSDGPLAVKRNSTATES